MECDGGGKLAEGWVVGFAVECAGDGMEGLGGLVVCAEEFGVLIGPVADGLLLGVESFVGLGELSLVI